MIPAEKSARPALRVVHAPGSGDDAIVAVVANAARPVVVFTSDRGLRDRVKILGAEVAGAGVLVRLLEVAKPPE